MRVLFVGNSYTYVNDLPYVVAVVAAARGIEIDYGMLAEPNYALPDHIVTGAYDRKLAEGWDYVVLQQGPSSLPENRELLRVWAVRAAESAHAAGVPLMVHYIIGMPGESAAEVNGTLAYAMDLYERFGAWPAVQYATPLPGTELARGRSLPIVDDC